MKIRINIILKTQDFFWGNGQHRTSKLLCRAFEISKFKKAYRIVPKGLKTNFVRTLSHFIDRVIFKTVLYFEIY